MSTALTWQIESTSLEDTLAIAGQIGRRLQGGEVIELVSDLGGGKTAFVRGLARGMGSNEAVHSPSFTISNQYQAGKLTLYHLDFYRLDEPGIMRDELSELLMDPQAIIAVEWADSVETILPANRLTVRIRATGDNSRRFSFVASADLHHLLQGVGA